MRLLDRCPSCGVRRYRHGWGGREFLPFGPGWFHGPHKPFRWPLGGVSPSGADEPGEGAVRAPSKDGRRCGLWGCGKSAVSVATLSTPGGCYETFVVCAYHEMMIRDAEPLGGVSPSGKERP